MYSNKVVPTVFEKPARIAQLVRALDLKTRGCGFESRAGQSNNH